MSDSSSQTKKSVDVCPECSGKTYWGEGDIWSGWEIRTCLICKTEYDHNSFPICKECKSEHVAEWLHWTGKFGFCSTKCYVKHMTENKLW